MIRPYLTNIIDEHKDGWKIQLTMEVTFVTVIKDSDKDSNEDSDKNYNDPYTIHIHGDETTKIIEHLDSLSKEYQGSLKTKMKRSDLVFDSVDPLCYKFHKISLNRDGSYIDSPEY